MQYFNILHWWNKVIIKSLKNIAIKDSIHCKWDYKVDFNIIRRIILSVRIAGIKLDAAYDLCNGHGGKFKANGKFQRRRDGPTESYEVVSSLFMAYISEALRHFLIFHKRFYGAPNFLRLFNETLPHCRLFSILAPN